MALPKFLSFGKTSSNTTVNLSKDTSAEVIDASQTSNSDIKLGSGATTITAGDYDTIEAGKGATTVYNARSSAVVGGAGQDTFIYGVGSKPQTIGMIGSATVDNSAYDGGPTAVDNKDTIEISKSFISMADLVTAITNANAATDASTNGRTLVIDGSDSIHFLASDKLSIDNFKLV